MRLTYRQRELLYAVVDGRVYGYLRGRTMESVLKKGLITPGTEPVVVSRPPLGIRGPIRTEPRQTWHLTPLGLEVYTKLRADQYEEQLKKLESGFRMALAQAKGRTRTPEVEVVEEESHARHP